MGFDRNQEGQLGNKSKTFIKKLKLLPSLSSVNDQLAYPDTEDEELDAAEYFFDAASKLPNGLKATAILILSIVYY